MPLTITSFEADENRVVTLKMEGMDERAKNSNITKIRVNDKPAPKPLLVDFDAQEIVFDAANCETGKINVEIQYLKLGPTVSATSAEDYQAPDANPDHDHPDEDAVVITLANPKRVSPGKSVQLSGRNFARLVDVQIDRAKVTITKGTNTASFKVPVPFKPGIYPIRFHDSNAAGLVTSTVKLEIFDPDQNPDKY